jgi:hypothetical protein
MGAPNPLDRVNLPEAGGDPRPRDAKWRRWRELGAGFPPPRHMRLDVEPLVYSYST